MEHANCSRNQASEVQGPICTGYLIRYVLIALLMPLPLIFGNKAVLTKTVKHWIPITLFFECSTEATFVLQTDSELASVGASVSNIHDGWLCY